MAPTTCSPSDVLRREAVIAGCVCLIFLSFFLYPQSADLWLADAPEVAPSPSLAHRPEVAPLSQLPHPPTNDSQPFEVVVQDDAAQVPPEANPRPRKCNLYDHPGHLHLPPLTWIPIGPVAPGCEAERSRAATTPAAFDRLARLADSSFNGGRLPEYLSNKLLLVVGDSDDRDTVEDLCWNVAGSIRYHYADGHEITDQVRSMGRNENIGDTITCVVRPGRGYTNWEATKSREMTIRYIWDQYFAERGGQEGGSAKLIEANQRMVEEGRRKVVAANMRTMAMWAEREGGKEAATVEGAPSMHVEAPVKEAGGFTDGATINGAPVAATGNTAAGGAIPGHTTEEGNMETPDINAQPLTDETQASADNRDKPPPKRRRLARRDGPNTADAFVVLFIHNYGIGLDTYFAPAANHARPGNSLYFDKIVHSARSLIDAIAPTRFPELLRRETSPERAQDVAGPPSHDPPKGSTENRPQPADEIRRDGDGLNPSTLIQPALIVAQSSIWELLFWRKAQPQRGNATSGEEAEVDSAVRWGLARLDDDLRNTFLSSFKTTFPGSPLAWRTCPSARQQFPNAIADINRHMADFGRREGLRVLDWERLVEGEFWPTESRLQSVEGTLAFSQMLLAEMEALQY
ncbi:hypothetical protein HK101_002110 [Irineochytrium annulatum]|nr:hypothetical protein HK101_002110 [Irineochytrium annulatum]